MASSTVPEAPSSLIGASGGVLTVVAFTVVHDIWISDIWFNVVPMLIAGAGCGACIAWAYGRSVERHSWFRWIGYSLLSAALLLGIGGVSLAMFEPRLAMAEVIDDPAALGLMLGPALPLIVVGAFGNSLVMWMIYGPRRTSLLPTIVTQSVLMALVGHNLALLGLVDIPTDQWTRVGVFAWLTLFLAAGYASSVMLITRTRLPQKVRASYLRGPQGDLAAELPCDNVPEQPPHAGEMKYP